MSDYLYAWTCALAEDAGRDHGQAAASWYFDGNTETSTYRSVLAGIEEGDPRVTDTFPAGPLSGEFADGPFPADVLSDLDVDDSDAAADEYLSAYEDGFYSASAEAIERAARAGSFPSDVYAWPGGYPLAYAMADGEDLCGRCLSDPSNPVSLTGTNGAADWHWTGAVQVLEGDYRDHGHVACAHCGTVLVPAPDLTVLRPGTYARESDGACLLFHSPTSWNCPAAGLRANRGALPGSLWYWRRVDGAEAEAAHRYAAPAPGEWFELDPNEHDFPTTEER